MYFTLFDFSWDEIAKGFSFITFSFGSGTERSVISFSKYQYIYTLEIVGRKFEFGDD
jgi:hypothetical protein